MRLHVFITNLFAYLSCGWMKEWHWCASWAELIDLGEPGICLVLRPPPPSVEWLNLTYPVQIIRGRFVCASNVHCFTGIEYGLTIYLNAHSENYVKSTFWGVCIEE